MKSKHYLGVQFGDYGPEIEPEILNAIVNRSRHALPEDYLDFLRIVNGGRPSPNGFIFANETNVSPDTTSFSDDEIRDLEEAMVAQRPSVQDGELKEHAEFLENVTIPKQVGIIYGSTTMPGTLLQRLEHLNADGGSWFSTLLPVGYELGGSTFVISLGDIDFGKIYCFCFEDVIPDDEGDMLQVQGNHLVANSFSEFLLGLFSAQLVIKEGYSPPPHLLDFYKLENDDNE